MTTQLEFPTLARQKKLVHALFIPGETDVKWTIYYQPTAGGWVATFDIFGLAKTHYYRHDTLPFGGLFVKNQGDVVIEAGYDQAGVTIGVSISEE